jgi:hypothetical protein
MAVDPPAEPHLVFDIPALPLADALKRYGAMTREPALFRSEMLVGLRSRAVRGRLTPQAALRLLLEGTGLEAEKVHTAAGMALALKVAGVPGAAPPAAQPVDVAGYPGLIQARVWAALCEDSRTRPGAYRSLLRFGVDAAGRIERPRLLGSTGNATRDVAMVQVLQRVRLASSPPADMPQPVTLLIVPFDADGGAQCPAAASPGAPGS